MAAVIVSAKEREEEAAEQAAEKTDTEEVVGTAAAQAIVQTPIALLARCLPHLLRPRLVVFACSPGIFRWSCCWS
jgi:hypothetical protein